MQHDEHGCRDISNVEHTPTQVVHLFFVQGFSNSLVSGLWYHQRAAGAYFAVFRRAENTNEIQTKKVGKIKINSEWCSVPERIIKHEQILRVVRPSKGLSLRSTLQICKAHIQL